MEEISLNGIRKKAFLLFLGVFISLFNETKSMNSLDSKEKDTHMGAHAMPPGFPQDPLNKKISKLHLSSYVHASHFYAYPLSGVALESIFSESLSCESFVTSLTQIPSLHKISVVEGSCLTPFHFKGQINENTFVEIYFLSHSVTRIYKWDPSAVSYQAQKNILYNYQNQPERKEEQKIMYVYVTLLDSDWEKPFRLSEIYEGLPYFFSEDFPEIGSKSGRSIVYFIPAFVKKFLFLDDESYWTHASEQEKWLYFLKYGFMHLDVPPFFRGTFFERVFEGLDLNMWNSDKIKNHIDEVIRKRNSFCSTPEAFESGEAKRKELILTYPISSEQHLDQAWPEEYSLWMHRALGAGIDFYSYLRSEATAPKNFSSKGFPGVAYFQEIFFCSKLDLMIDLASFWQGLYHREK